MRSDKQGTRNTIKARRAAKEAQNSPNLRLKFLKSPISVFAPAHIVVDTALRCLSFVEKKVPLGLNFGGANRGTEDQCAETNLDEFRAAASQGHPPKLTIHNLNPSQIEPKIIQNSSNIVSVPWSSAPLMAPPHSCDVAGTPPKMAPPGSGVTPRKVLI